MMNVGRHGYRINLFASSVEGARAVPELLAGVRYFNHYADRYDVFVIIRGGGSLESLQAFNNEMLVREIAAMPIPVIAGIGHEKDITLATLIADAGVSTPTAGRSSGC
jgi:exodeoxyribonuclease VII large subunit